MQHRWKHVLALGITMFAMGSATSKGVTPLHAVLPFTAEAELPVVIDPSTWEGDVDRSLMFARSKAFEPTFGEIPEGTTIRMWGRLNLGPGVGVIAIRSKRSADVRTDAYVLFAFSPEGTPVFQAPLAEFRKDGSGTTAGYAEIRSDLRVVSCAADGSCKCGAVRREPFGFENVACEPTDTARKPSSDSGNDVTQFRQLVVGIPPMDLPVNIDRQGIEKRKTKPMPRLSAGDVTRFLSLDAKSDGMFFGWGRFDLPKATALVVVRSELVEGKEYVTYHLVTLGEDRRLVSKIVLADQGERDGALSLPHGAIRKDLRVHRIDFKLRPGPDGSNKATGEMDCYEWRVEAGGRIPEPSKLAPSGCLAVVQEDEANDP
jgi:hypothetical protein